MKNLEKLIFLSLSFLWILLTIQLSASKEKWVEEYLRYEAYGSVYEKKGAIAIELGLQEGSILPYMGTKCRKHVLVDDNLDHLSSIKSTISQKDFWRISTFLRTLDSRLYDAKDCPYRKNTTTWKEFLFDAFSEHNKFLIKWIKVDLAGEEEWIFEDLLDTAFSKKAQILMRPQFDRWKQFQIEEYLTMLQHFDIYLEGEKVGLTVEEIRSLSGKIVLFQPKETGNFVKKNLTAVVIGYNLVTYIKQMVGQLQKYTKDIVILDNQSFFSPLIDFYEKEYPYSLLRMKKNYGFEVYQKPFMQNILGDVYLLTDPDLEFHPELPDNFLDELLKIQNHFFAHRVGFALKLDSENFRPDMMLHKKKLEDWEKAFWVDRLEYPPQPDMEVYSARIDTTFCLIHQKIPNILQLRIGGNYTCRHLPWYKNFHLDLLEGEYESYLLRNNSSNFFKIKKRASMSPLLG